MRKDYYEALYDAEKLAKKICKCYENFNVLIEIKGKDIDVLPDRFKFKIKLGSGTRVKDIENFAVDVQTILKLPLFQVKQVKLCIYIVTAMEEQTVCQLISVLRSPKYEEAVNSMGIAHPIGFDAMREAVIQDLTLYPHVLIAGTTGSGKSIAIKTLLLSILVRYNPSRVNLLVCDMAGELLQFDNFPHLSHSVIQDFDSFLYAVIKLKDEMERRILLKGSKEYSKLPYIVCVVDEFTSFIAGTDTESKQARMLIMEILRRGRHAKIHLVLAAHNPTQQRLKIDLSDIPTKMAFRVARQSNSLAILSEGGAEKLSGNGDMLFQSSQSDKIQRIQGAFISPQELQSILVYIKFEWSRSKYDTRYKFTINDGEMQEVESGLEFFSKKNNKVAGQSVEDKVFAKIVIWALQCDSVSCNMITDTFHVGWQRANRFIERLHKLGIVGDLDSKLPRKVLTQSVEDISEKVKQLLLSQGYTIEMISEAFSKR